MPNLMFHVEFSIEVCADSPVNACRRAWELMTAPDAMLPVGTVTTLPCDELDRLAAAQPECPMAGEREDVDLQDLEETGHE